MSKGIKLTTEEFISRSKLIHENKYDYSKVEYKNSQTKVEIICPIHGSFYQTPAAHLAGSGCPICGIEKANKTTLKKGKRLTTEEFIERAKKIHGDKYDYSLVEYVNLVTPVKIICPIDGVFLQRPDLHFRGAGCQICSQRKLKMEQEEFIRRSVEIHGDKYDYSKVIYVNSVTPVEIICKDCNEPFFQKPTHHLSGSGCPVCGRKLATEKTKKLTTLTIEEFIKRAHEIHGNKYDYSKVVYVNYHTKVEIICPEHGPFFQAPGNHLNGNGCPKCSRKIVTNAVIESLKARRKTTEEFIEEAKKVHGDTYDYSKVKYEGVQVKIEIICPEHGSFFQSPYMHLKGQGCPICGKEKVKETQQAKKLTTEEFIRRTKEVHGDKYDYSKVKYIDGKTAVEIICPIHGPFLQSPSNHLRGCGCRLCSTENMAENHKLGIDEFIRRAKEIHGDKYDYGKAIYIDWETPLEIICPEHGSFWKSPKMHLKFGTGCPKCKEYSGETKIRTWLENQKFLYKKYQEYKDLIYKKPLNTDFYIESCNLAIEYQGGQHYKPVQFKGISKERAEQNFKEQQIKDKIKEEYFKNSDIDLLCIHYKDYKKIDEILEKVIIEKDYEYLKTTNSYIF